MTAIHAGWTWTIAMNSREQDTGSSWEVSPGQSSGLEPSLIPLIYLLPVLFILPLRLILLILLCLRTAP